MRRRNRTEISLDDTIQTNPEDTKQESSSWVGIYPSSSTDNRKPLRILVDTIHLINGIEYVVMVTVDKPLKGYLIEKSKIEYRMHLEQLIDTTTAIGLYDWEEELDKLIPSREAVLDNIRLSFWKAGALDRDSAKDVNVQRSMFNSAFPFSVRQIQLGD